MKKFIFFMIIFATIAGSVLSRDKLPCRINARENPILFMTLGDIKTPVAEGFFVPGKDLVVLKNGKEIPHYYRDKLGIKFFTPIDKTHFSLPPSGWCSWYFYYQEINAEEVLKNARWMAENLKEYGARYIQIDDGWQGTGHGLGENRDWFTIDVRFRTPGMKAIADRIKSLGIKAGLWLAPHGESNPEIVRKFKNAFFLGPDGKSLSSTWEGTYLVKPSSEGKKYLKHLFRTLKSWGYDYFKIDGQPIVINEYKRLLGEKGVELYRETLRAIREAIGPDTYLLGCWGIPLAGAGIMNGSRTGGDIRLGWEGFLVAVDATMRWYFLHNIVWYADPDVIVVRPPMSMDTARAWATLQGLTGQALMASDMMYALPEERVKLLKKIYPAVNITPMDLFPSNAYKKIWDLKVNHVGKQYDVVAVFNYKNKKDGEFLRFKDLGLKENALYHVFDFWAQEYLGAWKGGFYVEVPAQGVRVLTVIEEKPHPILISTSRHITQGWVDLKELKNDKNEIHGKSYIIKDDGYTLSFAYPRGKCHRVTSVKTTARTVVKNHGTWSEIIFYPEKSGEYTWDVKFERIPCHTYPVRKPFKIMSVKPTSTDEFIVRWWPLYSLTAGYNVYIDGKLLGYSPVAKAKIRINDLINPHKLEVKAVWYDGRESKKALPYTLKPSTLFPDSIFLSDLDPYYASAGWGTLQKDLSMEGATITIGGNKYRKGLGTHAPSKIKYKIGGLFSRFKAIVGIDDETEGKGSVNFRVIGDGKVLWESGKMKAGETKKVDVEIKDIKILVLEVTDGGDGKDYDHADWAEARLIKF